MLDGLQIIPYQLELRNLVDATLFHLGELEREAAEALAAQDSNRGMGQTGAVELSSQGRLQTAVFDRLEQFLAAFARLSLLIFPVSTKAFAMERAETMQYCLGLDDSSPIADRDLRDHWMHHDERLDYAVAYKLGAGGQVFSRSSEDSFERLKGVLRVIELDTLIIYVRDRKGQPHSAGLRGVRSALSSLADRADTAFIELPVPDAG